ncbi:MAG: response regulator [Patescibacteria group bacterium]
MSLNNKRILVIEDDPAELFAMKKMIQEAGYEILTASDGQTGLNLIKKEKPDLVFLDIILPKINGFDILELVKKDPQVMKIPIIVLTNLNDEETAMKSRTLGAADHLIKMQVYPHDIIRKIDKFLNIDQV